MMLISVQHEACPVLNYKPHNPCSIHAGKFNYDWSISRYLYNIYRLHKVITCILVTVCYRMNECLLYVTEFEKRPL